jgi:hypothetical protein
MPYRARAMAAVHRDALSGVVLNLPKRRPFVAVGDDGDVGKPPC